MTRLKKIAFVILSLLFFAAAGLSQNITNKGKEFWVGYGHHQFMEAGGDNSQVMTIYLSAEEQTATVWVTIDSSGVGGVLSTWWRRRYIIPAGTVISMETTPASGGLNVGYTSTAGSVGQIPKGTGGTYDARLVTDAPPAGTGGAGIFRKKGIHIESDVPIVAYAHIYGSAASGATMLLPTEAWGYSYISLNSFQSYASNCYNWMYVMAKSDNTVIEITPSVKTRAQNFTGLQPGVSKQITLMKGQIYQVIGANTASDADGNNGTASTGFSLSGTKVRSVANASGQCYPVAVFAGSSRTANPASCGSGGGDNDNQQLFPQHAWGKRYLTTPFSGSSTPSSFGTSIYKVAVKDPATIVKRNGTALTGLQNGNFYVYESNTPDYLEADQPIMVVQFMTGGGCLGSGGLGDPEMVVISPIEQAIKRTGFYRNNKESISVNYLSLVIPTAGLASLKIDGSSSFTYTQAHPQKAGYTIVVQRWSPASAGQSIAQSDSAFTGIVYGEGSVESYGYNAGTSLNNLAAVSSVRNTPDTNTAVKSHPYTFVSTPTQISALITYKPNKIVWKFSTMTPAGFISPFPSPDPVVVNPVPYDSILVGAAWQYYYLCPGGPFTFSQIGTYYLPIRLTSPVPGVGDCNNEEEVPIEIIVKQKPFANFTTTVRGCGRDTISFTGPSTTSNGYVVKEWKWRLSTGDTSIVKNPTFVLDPGSYTMKLSIIVENGGIADTTISFVNPARPVVNFNINPNPACPGPVTFSTSSTYTGTPGIANWYWDLSNGPVINSSSSSNQVKTYALGTYTIKHSVKINNYCIGDTLTKTLTVTAGAMVDFTYPQSCVPSTGVAQFTSNSANQAGITYSWNFGDPSSGSANTSSAQNPTHTYATNGTYSVSFHIVTPSCTGDTTFQVVIKKRAILNYPGPLPAICRSSAPVSVASATHDTTSGTGYYYDSTGNTTSAGMFNPVAGIGTHKIWYVFTTTQGCKDSVSTTITVNAGGAKPSVVTPVNYCQNSTASPLTATPLAGNTLKWYDNPALTNGSTTAPTPSTATAGTVYYYVTQVPASGCESDTSIITVNITPAITNNTIAASQTICSGSPTTPLNSSATIAGGTGTYTYQWQSSPNGTTWNDIAGATSASYDAGVVNTTTYYRRNAGSGLCGNTSNVDTITAIPVITNYDIAPASQNICEGATPVLIDGQTPSPAASSYTYTWEQSTDGGSTWTTVPGATGEDYQPGQLTLTTKFKRNVVNGPCAAISNFATVIVNPLANGSISGPTSICENNSTGASITFVATTGTAPYSISYTVTNPAGASTTYTPTGLSNNEVIPVIPVGAAPGNYTITLNSITNSNGCVKSTGLNSITINVTAIPIVGISANPGTTVCEGTSVTITATGANSYSWSTSATGASINVTPTTNTTYDVTGSSNGCSAAPKSITITVNPKPAKPSVTTPVTYCQNSPAVPLSATGGAGNTLNWFTNTSLTGGSTTVPTPSTSTAGTVSYYVNQTTAANCTGDTSTIVVTVQPVIANNVITADQTICSGTSANTLSASGTPTGGNGTYTYQWEQSTGAGWSPVSGATSATYNPGALLTSTQFRRVVSSGLCSNTSVAVSITVVPAITNNNISPVTQTICDGSAATLITGTAGATGVSFNWISSTNGGTTWTATGSTGKDYQPVSVTTTTLYKRVALNGPCTDTSNVATVVVNPLANGSISGTSSMCQYDAGTVTFTATAGTAPYSVKLTITDPNGATSTITQSVNSGGSITVLPANTAIAGTYTVAFTSLTNSNGCVRTSGLNSITIVVTATPVVTLAPAGPICEGKTAALSASGATTYAWSAGSVNMNLSSTSGSNVNATPSAAGSYSYVVVGTTNGCTSAAANGTLVVNPKPAKPAVVTPVTYCQLGPALPLQATASGSNTLKWYDNAALTGGVTSVPTPSTASAGNILYYVTQTNSFGCESDTSITTIIVNPGISGNTISGGETICQGSTPATPLTNAGTLTGGSGSYTYQWQQSTNGGSTWNDISGATNPNYSPGTLNTTTQFRRVVTSGLCGSISNVIQETVLIGLGNYDISASQTVCESAPVALLDGQTTTGTGPFTYTWQQSADGTNWVDIPSSNTEDYQPPALTVTTYYRRKVTNGPCTGISSPVMIAVKPLANGSITATSPAICEYEADSVKFVSSIGTAPFALVLTITNPAGVSSTKNVTVNSGDKISVIPVNSAAGNYTITLNSITSNGCTRSTGLNSVTITVNATPNITKTDVIICENDTARLSASVTGTGTTTYTWGPAGAGLLSTTGSQVNAIPTSNTVYTVTATTNGCSAQRPVSVTVNPKPVVSIVASKTVLCLNDNVTFSVTSSIASGSITTYAWDFDNGNTFNGANPPVQTYSTHRVYNTKLYAVSDKNCTSATDTKAITVNPLPVAGFTTPAFVCLPNNIATFQNTSTIANGAQLNYVWNFGDPASFASNTSTATNGTHVYPDSAKYTITLNVVSAQNCAAQISKDFSAFFRKPVAKFGVTPDTLCQGVQNLFSDSSFAAGSTIQKRLWLFGDGNSLQDSTNAAKIYTRPGNYKVALVVQNSQGCSSDTAYKNIIVYLQPVIDAGSSFVVPVGTTVTFNASSNSGALQFAWTSPTGATVSNPAILKPQYIANQDAKFVLTATGQGNCKAWDSMSVKVLHPIAIPNAFSPNGDGINEKWDIRNLGDYPNCVVQVFNRYGQAVFTSFGYTKPWDGTYKDKPLPVGTYYYVIEPKNGFPAVTGYVVIVK